MPAKDITHSPLGLAMRRLKWNRIAQILPERMELSKTQAQYHKSYSGEYIESNASTATESKVPFNRNWRIQFICIMCKLATCIYNLQSTIDKQKTLQKNANERANGTRGAN